MDNRIFTNENIRKKGKRVEITVKDKQNGDIRTLLVTPQKDGSCQIQVNGEKNQLYTRQRGATKTIAADTGFQQFFHTDTTCLQGTSTAMTAGWDLTPVSSIYPTISPARTTRL